LPHPPGTGQQSGTVDRGVAKGGQRGPSREVVVKSGRGGKTHFELLASNGRVVATSETFESKQSCLKGIAAVKRLAADAAVVVEEASAPAKVASKARRVTTAARTAKS
jgi:uncharacterized protein